MTVIKESRPLVESMSVKQPEGNKRMRVRIIEGERWGSSGFYSKKVLERDGPTVFAPGTQMYIDHPSESEEYDRPERSIRDLAGKIVSVPVYESDGLYSDVDIYSHVAPVIAEMAEDIGLSIRASATVEAGEANGRRGDIITKLIKAESVDFVTKAGAGGKVVELMESARKKAQEAVSDTDWSDFSASDYDIAQWKRACLIDTGEGEEDSKARYKLPVREPNGDVNRNGVHAAAARINQVEGISDDLKKKAARALISLYRNQLDEDPPESLTNMVSESGRKEVEEATFTERFELLNNAVREKTGVRWSWLRDFDETTVWYHAEGDDDVGRMYQATYTLDGTKATIGDPIEVVAQTKYVPATEGAKSVQEAAEHVPGSPPAGTPTPSKESSMGDVTVAESRLRELEESAKQVDPLKEQLTESQKETKEALVTSAKETRRANEAEANLVVYRLMDKAKVKGDKLAESLAKNPPLTEDGKVDEKALTESVKETLGEVTAGISENHGGVKGFGAGDGETEISDSIIEAELASAFGREVRS